MLSLSVASQGGGVNIYKLHSVLLLQVEILLVEHVDAINHLLDKLDLGISQSVLVRDVVCATGLAARFAPGAPGLQVQLLTACLQGLQALLGPAGKVDVD